MSFLTETLTAAKAGGPMIYPLSLLCLLALALICDKIFLYKKNIKLPPALFEVIETYNFNWSALQSELARLGDKNIYREFFEVIVKNKDKPLWWLESRANDEAKIIEKKLGQGLWILETIITAAPLIGLLGTIVGMMSSFKIIGENGVVNPNGVTGGVAESLIATGFGLFIAIISLFAFNYFSRKQDQLLDELERLGSRVVDHIKLDKKES